MAPPPGKIGLAEKRRYLVLHRASVLEATQYADTYNVTVLYHETRGITADVMTKGLTTIVGPSRAMKHLINELKSMSNTSGEWEFIIPRVAERYFLVTLRNMEDHSVTNASGKVILVDSHENTNISSEVNRVMGEGFKVEGGIVK